MNDAGGGVIERGRPIIVLQIRFVYDILYFMLVVSIFFNYSI